jgi:hypothetical protein
MRFIGLTRSHDDGAFVPPPAPPNNAFKPKMHRYVVSMAGTACHAASYALQLGST